MAAKIYRINYKSDFILTMNSDAGWAIPFCIKFFTSVPSRAYFVSFDGTTYTHCAYDPSEPTKLVVQFDDHHLPIGDLNYQIAYHFTVADFPNDTEDEVINPAAITTEIDGETYHVMLDFTGETAPEIEFNLPAYANEAQRIANEESRIQNELQRQQNEAQRIQNELEREQASAAAVAGAEKVDAELNGNTLTVTNRNGVSKSVNTKGETGAQGPVGPQGPEGPSGPTGTSIVSFTYKSETTIDVIYTVNFSNGNKTDVSIPKGEQGETGPQGPEGPAGSTGVSITSFVYSSETDEDVIYTVNYSNGNTSEVAIPKGPQGDVGPTGPQGPQGPKGDTVILGDGVNYTLYNTTGQNTDGAMTQKATTDAINFVAAQGVSYDNSNYGLASKNVQGALDQLASQVISWSSKFITVSKSSGKWINYNTNTWASLSGTKYYLIPVTQGEIYKVYATNVGNVHVAFLTSNSTSGSAQYVSGTGIELVGYNNPKTFVVPMTATYMYLLTAYNNQTRFDKLEQGITSQEQVNDIETQLMLEGAEEVMLKQGYYDNTTDGKSFAPLTTRAVTTNYLPPYTTIICGAGYYIRGLYRYRKSGNDFVYVDYINFQTQSVPYISYYLDDPNYYVRPIFHKGDGTGVVVIEDVLENVRRGTDELLGSTLDANVELQAYLWDSPTNTPYKVNTGYPNRMRSGGQFHFSTSSILSIKCKSGYECTVTIYTIGIQGQIYSTGWGKEHKYVVPSMSDAHIHFRKADNTNVSSSDLNCVDYFRIDNVISTKILNKKERPWSAGYVDFEVSCNTYIADTVSSALTLQDGETIGTDKCRLYLPNNYSRSGIPTRLVIHCHGASVNYNYNNYSDIGINQKILDYLLAMGYAVLFVSGMAGNNTLQIGTTAGNPLAYQSHVKAYQYVIKNYNIRQDGCFVYGISAGSIPALQIANFTDIPVLAQVIYCGIYSVSRAFMLLGGYDSFSSELTSAMKQYIADQYDFQGSVTWSTTDPVSDDEWKYLIDNVMRFAGWNTFLRGATTRMSQSEYADLVGDYYGSTLPSWIDAQDINFDTIEQFLMAFKVQQKNTQSPSGDLLAAVNAEKALYNSVSLHRDVPLKIFHATDDATAPYRYAQYYYEMLKRGGSQVEFRTFQSGGHAPMGNNITVTVNGNNVDTNVFSVESLDFLRRFE